MLTMVAKKDRILMPSKISKDFYSYRIEKWPQPNLRSHSSSITRL